MVSQVLCRFDRHLVTFGKGVVLFWIVTCLGPPQLSAIQNKPTPAKEAPVRAESELTPEKTAPITPKTLPVGPRNARVRELQEERLKVLQDLVKASETAFASDQLSLEALCKARENLLEAQLEFCDTKADRIRVHQESVEAVKSLHNRVHELFLRGRVGGEATRELSARSHLLKAQIALEKEKALPN
jgi:hypothetical protein